MAVGFLQALSIVLCVAAVTTIVFQRLRQPVVLGYIIAGLIIGPHLPVPLVADAEIVKTLSELGVILLMFVLGLEFRIGKLVQLGPTSGITAVVQCAFMGWLGFIVGRVFGWTTLESLFCGALIAISSTTIIAKAFDEQKIGGRMRELVVGILIVEDLIAVLLMTMLTAISSGTGLSASELFFTIGRLLLFLVGLVAIGMLIVPRAIRYATRTGRSETILVCAIGICFAVSLLAHEAGYSVALGAFIAGSLVAESGEASKVEHVVQPVRDMFAAVFFVSVGMLIDPRLVLDHWVAIVVLTVVVIVGKIVGVSLGAFFTGVSVKTSVQAGLSLAQIGEFSFIIASLGLTLDATGSFLYPVAVAVSAITTLTTPWLIRSSGPVAAWVDRRMPPSLQTFTALYGGWIDQLRTARNAPTGHKPIRRLVGLLVLDGVALAAIVIASSVFDHDAQHYLEHALNVPEPWSRWILIGVIVAVVAVLGVGVVRVARRLGIALAQRALPAGEDGRVDLAARPRRVFVLTLQLAAIVLVGVPTVALTQPFLSGYIAALLFAALVLVLAVVFWRSTLELEGHVRAGSAAIVEMLARVAHGKPQHATVIATATADASDSSHAIDVVDLGELPLGLGKPVSVVVGAGSAAVGRTLADLELRGRTGATVLAVVRDGVGSAASATAALQAGDVLALSGSSEAVRAAIELLR